MVADERAVVAHVVGGAVEGAICHALRGPVFAALGLFKRYGARPERR